MKPMLFIASAACCLAFATASLRNIVCKEDEDCENSLCCSFEDLFAVPDTAFNFQSTIHPAHIRRIRFLRSNFPEIPPGMFSYFTSVAEVDFRGTGLSKTNDYSFTGARRLINLDLSHNAIERLVNMMFYGAFRLGFLDLSHNHINHVEENFLYGVKSLNTLDLSFNRIKVLPDKVFNSVESLYSLNLANNLLSSLHSELFFDNLFLTKIDLSYNNLAEIDKKVFRYNKNVRVLNLSHNALESDDFIGDMDFNRIEDLDLSYNFFGNFNWTLFQNMRNLRKLSIAQNQLQYVDFTALGSLKNLFSLNISRNHLTNLALNGSAVLDNLARLYADGIGLQYLNTKVVRRALPNLKYISLSGNKWNCNYLKTIREELRQSGVEDIDIGTDCGSTRPANLVAFSQKNCIDEVALARIKVKEIIAARLQTAEEKLLIELKRIVNKKTQEIIDELAVSSHSLLNLVIE